MPDRLSQLTALHEADPSDPFLTYGIALEHAKVHRFEEQVQWLDRTLELDREYAYAYYQKAKAYSELGKEAEARSVLETGIHVARQSTNPDAAHAAQEMQELLETIG